MKRSNILMISILSIQIVVGCPCPEYDWENDIEICPCQNSDGSYTTEYVSAQISNNQDFTGTTTEPVTVTISGHPVTINPGEITYSSSSLTTASSIDYKGRTIRNIQDFKISEDGSYSVADVEYLEGGQRKIIRATGVTGSDTQISAQNVETVTEGGSYTSSAAGYTATGEQFTVNQAGSVAIGGSLFPDLGPSTFAENRADLTSAKDQNKMTMPGLDVHMDNGDRLVFEKDGRYTIETSGRIVDYEGAAERISLLPGGRYEYRDFAIENPGETKLAFCLKTDQTNYGDCNLVDTINDRAVFDQGAVYEKKGGPNYLDIIDTRSGFELELASLTAGQGTYYSGPFVIRNDGKRWFGFGLEVPYAIKFLEPDITISEHGFLKLDGFTMHAGASRDRFLQRYQELLP